MSVEISIAYSGELRCESRHGPSSATLLTDAPCGDHGRGASFSPTDLERAAIDCPVNLSLDPRIERTIRFVWGEEIAASEEADARIGGSS